MKTKQLVFLSVVFVLILTACGGGGGSGEPAGVVEKVANAMQTLDIERVQEYMCSERKDALKSDLDSGFAELESMGLDPDELLDAFKIKMSDMKYEEKSAEGDKAVVHVSGTMAMEFDTEKLKSFLKKAAEASGEEVSDDQVDFMVNMFSGMSGQEAPIDGDVQLVKEDGKWVVCDDLAFLEGSDLMELPIP
jgi:hypothetical protein